MPLNLGQTKKSTGPLVPAGSHIARCYAVIEMGTHTEEGKYGVKTNRKLRFSWELPDVTHVFDEAKGPQPMAIHMMVNFIGGPRSTLVKMLEAWRGRSFTKEEQQSFEIKNVLGAPCMLNVIHKETETGTYANVDSVAPLPARLRKDMPGPINHPIYYEVEMGHNTIYKTLPEWMQDFISKSEEWTEDLGKGDEPPDNVIFQPEKDEDEDESSNPF
jgi:hypothetical protein